jgi:hypothetical protein
MKFSEYGKHLDSADTLSESEKSVIKDRLLEAKMKIKELKKAQAEKMQGKDKVKEGVLSGGERPCTECGGTGMVYEEPKAIPDHVKGKIAKYNTMMKATKAAHKRMDANHNGIPDDEEVEEGTERSSKDDFDDRAKEGDTYKTAKGGEVTKTKTGIKHEKKYSDSFKGHGASKDKDLGEGKKAKKDYDQDGKIESGKDEYLGSRIRAAKKAGKMDEASNAFTQSAPYPSFKKKKPVSKEVDKPSQASQAKPKSKEEEKVNEAKPSAGLSKAKKSAVVKKAKAGGDIGKPGKSFDKVAQAAGGGEKGKKIAAAAMWKNVKEEIAYVAERSKAAKPDFLDMDKDGNKKESMKKAVADKKETVKESSDMNRLRELMTRLNG